jgi:hypothetical protein
MWYDSTVTTFERDNMIQDDLENLDLSKLNQLEQMEFNIKLLNSYNKLIRQLLAGQNYGLAGLMSIGLQLQTVNPASLNRLLEYAQVLHTNTLHDIALNKAAEEQRKVLEAANNPQETKTDETPSDVIDVEGKEN